MLYGAFAMTNAPAQYSRERKNLKGHLSMAKYHGKALRNRRSVLLDNGWRDTSEDTSINQRKT